LTSQKKIRTSKPKNNGKHPGGAPVKYTPEVLSGIAKEMIVWFKKKRNWWLKDFAIQKGIVWRYVLELANNHQELSDALELCKQIQESKLVHKSFQPYQDRPAAFALKNACGWRDRTDVDMNHKGEIRVVSAIPRPELSKTIVSEDGALAEANNKHNGNGVH
jgi:hypothetical protein